MLEFVYEIFGTLYYMAGEAFMAGYDEEDERQTATE